MKSIFYILLPAVSCLLSSITVPAADLPSLPVAPQIKTGVLDNGIAYYLVTNSTEKGRADIALIQKGGYGYETPATAGSSAVHAMGSLAALPHFRSETPFRYLSRNCIWPGSEGYVAVYDDATVYRFRNLELARSKDLVDSTLLLVFDIIGSTAENAGDRYAPMNQAIVVSGDVDAGAVLNKMNMLSMLVPRRGKADAGNEYGWHGTSGAVFRSTRSEVPGMASVYAEYVYPRTPKSNMNTVQPLVAQKFASELGIMLRKRLARALRESEVPYSEIKYSYVSSKEGPGDEKFRIGITTSGKYLDNAVRILSGTLANLDTYGSLAEEYRDAQNELIMNMRRDYSGDVINNVRYIDQCISSYLYGSSLASSSTSMDFFLKKNMQDDVSVRLFNNFVFALLDKSRNLTLECSTDSASGDDIIRKFSSAWIAKVAAPYTVSYGDTLKLGKSSSKLKIKTVAQEPLSGGQIWTFDNGLKVIFRNAPGTGMFHYMWLLKGGCSLVPGLKAGEAAYVSDMLRLYDVPGMSCYSFSDMLAANGISMRGDVTTSDFRISGAAPSSRLRLLLRSLHALAENRSMNRKAYDYYRECQAIRMLGGSSMDAVLDSLMFPGNTWSAYKRPITLADDFQKRAEKFFDSEFSKMNDGVLILVGDFDEFTLKKDLCRDLGGFSTEKVSSFRSRLQYRVGSGHAGRVSYGTSERAVIGLSAPLTYTSSNFMASYIAAMAMQDRVSSALAGSGWYGTASWDFMMFPEERFNFKVSCSMSGRTGMPASMVQSDSVEQVVAEVRKSMTGVKINAKELAVYRSVLLKSISARLSDPEMIMSMLVLRYSYGKDLVTRYKEKINEVNADDVNRILALMADSRSADFAVRTRYEGEHIKEIQPAAVHIGRIPAVVASAADTLGISRDGLRAIGIDTTAFRPVWLDTAVFRRFIRTVPAPVPPQQTEDTSAACADSLVAAHAREQADTLEIQVLQARDSVVTAVPDKQ